MKLIEESVHEALTRVTAALDWMHKAEAAAGVTHISWTAGLNNASREMRDAQEVLKGCWMDCDDCGDHLWRDMLAFNPDAGVPDMATGGYTGKNLCPACWRKRDNYDGPSDEERAEAYEHQAARVAKESALLRDAGRLS